MYPSSKPTTKTLEEVSQTLGTADLDRELLTSLSRARMIELAIAKLERFESYQLAKYPTFDRAVTSLQATQQLRAKIHNEIDAGYFVELEKNGVTHTNFFLDKAQMVMIERIDYQDFADLSVEERRSVFHNHLLKGSGFYARIVACEALNQQLKTIVNGKKIILGATLATMFLWSANAAAENSPGKYPVFLLSIIVALIATFFYKTDLEKLNSDAQKVENELNQL